MCEDKPALKTSLGAVFILYVFFVHNIAEDICGKCTFNIEWFDQISACVWDEAETLTFFSRVLSFLLLGHTQVMHGHEKTF